jgi:protein-L-isoaspartate(D-aspartate) O-methyltransferase
VTDEFALLRERLAAQVIAANGIANGRVAAALNEVARHLFLPGLPPEAAYRDDAIVTKRDASGLPVSSSSQPAIMAIMLEQLKLAPGHRVLEIGAGTGYNAALMRHIVGPSGLVVSVDIDADLVERAREHLADASYPDVVVLAADGAEGCPAHAPYDRVIATVGVSDLAPAWLDQATERAMIVAPLDVRGAQLSVAFGRTGRHWTSRSLAPCGFMRMRGSLSGTERVVLPQPGLAITLHDGRDLDPAALAAALAGPQTEQPTGVRTASGQVFWGLSLWLAIHEPRWCGLSDERGQVPLLAHGPLRTNQWRTTFGIADDDGIAMLAATDVAQGSFALCATGFGPGAARLAADLAAQVGAWDEAGRPGPAGLHVDAYPRSSPDQPYPLGDEPVIERPATRFVVYRT